MPCKSYENVSKVKLITVQLLIKQQIPCYSSENIQHHFRVKMTTNIILFLCTKTFLHQFLVVFKICIFLEKGCACWGNRLFQVFFGCVTIFAISTAAPVVSWPKPMIYFILNGFGSYTHLISCIEADYCYRVAV